MIVFEKPNNNIPIKLKNKLKPVINSKKVKTRNNILIECLKNVF